MRTRNKIWSVLLALALTLAAVPAYAAVTASADLITALQDGTASTITLGGNITLSTTTVSMGASHTIETGGFTLTISGGENYSDGGRIDLGTHTLTLKGNAVIESVQGICSANGMLNLEDVTATLKIANSIYAGTVNVNSGATVNLNSDRSDGLGGSLLTLQNSTYLLNVNAGGVINIQDALGVGINNSSSGKININSGGAINIGVIRNENWGVVLQGSGVLKLNSGGTLSGTAGGAIYLGHSTKINGMNGKFIDQGTTLTAAGEVTVGADDAPVSATGLSAGLYVCNGSNLFEKAAITAPAITTTTLPSGTVGAAYSQTLATTGTTPITWSIDNGTLPAGLLLNGLMGVISGTPTTAGTANFTVKATNGAGDDTQALGITINTAGGGGSFVPVTNIIGIPSEIMVGTHALTATILPANATNKTIVWSVNNAGTTGASISGNTLTTTAPGTLTVTATIVNGAGTGSNYTKDFNITVSAAPLVIDPLNSITIGTVSANLGANEGGTGWSWDGAAKTLTISSDIADTIDIASTADGIKIHIADNANVPQITKTGGGSLNITGSAGKTLTVSDTNGPAISSEGDLIIGSGIVKARVTGTGNTDPAIASGGNITITGTASVTASNFGTGANSTAIGAGGDLTIAGSAAVQAIGAGSSSGGAKSGGKTLLSTIGNVEIKSSGTADAVNAAGGIEISNGTNTIEAAGTGYALNGNGAGIAITGGYTDITSADPNKTTDSTPAMSGTGTVVVINGQPAFGDPNQNPDPNSSGGGGCDAGTSIFALCLLPLVNFGRKRRTILPKN